ncbi:MAG TPA: hypothetical protein VKY27_12160 [Bacteriovoracaceae bacterium]|nr:hypothetical protein [Bacteriovoracaceae bacterium]
MKVNSALALIFTLFSSKAFAFNKDFTVISDKTPYEFNVMFNSLRGQLKKVDDQMKLVGYSEDLNRNLGFLEKEHIFLLIKSEVIKSVLEYRFEKSSQFDITTNLIEKLEKRFNDQERYLTDFSRWIWRSLIAELKHRQKLGLITQNSFNPELFSGEKKAQAVRFQRYLHYLMPWIDQMENLDHQRFNELSVKVSWEILRKLNDRSLLFKNMSYAQGAEATQIFNIPAKLQNLTPDKVKELKFLEENKSLREESQRERSEATDQINQIEPNDLSPLSDEISKKIEAEGE